jgi:hypothetical protein
MWPVTLSLDQYLTVVQIIVGADALLPNVGVNSCFLAEDSQVGLITAGTC